jgi:hypothetical protein
MRLTTSECGFLDATPVRPGLLVDFSLSTNELGPAIALADSFWRTHHSYCRRTKLIEGVIHTLFLSHCPLFLEFERFTYLYTALDACYALTKSITGTAAKPHAERIQWMCEELGLPVPHWATPVSRATTVSIVRNNALHEALFFDEPLGFAVSGGSPDTSNVTLEMAALVCRLVIALLGKRDCHYVRSPVNTYQQFELDLFRPFLGNNR